MAAKARTSTWHRWTTGVAAMSLLVIAGCGGGTSSSSTGGGSGSQGGTRSGSSSFTTSLDLNRLSGTNVPRGTWGSCPFATAAFRSKVGPAIEVAAIGKGCMHLQDAAVFVVRPGVPGREVDPGYLPAGTTFAPGQTVCVHQAPFYMCAKRIRGRVYATVLGDSQPVLASYLDAIANTIKDLPQGETSRFEH